MMQVVGRPTPRVEGELKVTGKAQKLGVKAQELALANHCVVHKKSKRKLSFAEIVKAKGAPIHVLGYYNSRQKSHDASVSAQIAEVHVDPETGQVTLRNMVSAHSTGKVNNPLMHQGQVEGGVVFGLGFALTEEVLFDGGKITTTNFGEFKIPNITDLPPLKTAVMENVPTAVADACGVRITDLRVTSEKVYRALRARSA
jgi:CO/xanthine dehydrogenase Mo-binding subunit